ncbi:MAG: SRPBCC family protein [Nocardioides sp.]
MSDAGYTVEREAVIDAPPDRIYAQIIDFRHWPTWSPWEDLDPAMQRSYSGAERGPGAVYAWSGNRKAGAGRMEITDASEPHRVDIDLAFEKPFRARNEIRFVLTREGGGTLVTWRMRGQKTFATKVMGLFMSMDSMVGKDFEKGLSRLKAVTEAMGGAPEPRLEG